MEPGNRLDRDASSGASGRPRPDLSHPELSRPDLSRPDSGPDAGPPVGGKPSVLIADNDVHVTAILSAFLVDQGFEVLCAGDGEAALAMLEQHGVDLLVCDLCMPRLPGEQVLQAMAERGLATPAYVISGFLDDRQRDRLQAHPFVRGVLQKPFDLRAFAEAAARGVRNSEAPQKGSSSA